MYARIKDGYTTKVKAICMTSSFVRLLVLINISSLEEQDLVGLTFGNFVSIKY